jgi:predicted HNH restriction endonuclease
MAALLDELPETAPAVEVPSLAVEESAVEGRKMFEESTRHARNPALTACRLELDRFECQHCHFKVPQMLSAPDGHAPLGHHVVEVHHITPIRVGERRTRLTDIVTLCPTCHRLLHAVASALGRDELPVSLLEICGLQAEHVWVEHDSDIA